VNWQPRFVDTGYWIAFFNAGDGLHGRALTLARQLDGPLVTTTIVLVEVADGLASAPTRHLATRFLERVREDPNVTIVALTADLLDRSIERHVTRADKEWGLTDCISFVVMEERGIREALAYDQHFIQAGFRALLRDS
jgi:predicted nucleic acid-binding protein